MPHVCPPWQRNGGSILVLAATACWALGSGTWAWGQLPSAQLNSIFPPGGKAGTAVEVQLAGDDLDDVDSLVFSHAGITAAVKMGPVDEFSPQPKPLPGAFTVTIAGNVPAGIYECCALGRFGMSNPRAFQVGTGNELLDDGTTKQASSPRTLQAGDTLSGIIEAEATDHFAVQLKAQERLVVSCSAQRIDSKLDGALRLFDAVGRELARARDNAGNDPVLEFQAPAEGLYRLTLSDFLFAGGTDYFYRLTLSAGPRIDAVFPPSGLPGSNQKFTVYGRNLPGGSPAPEFSVAGQAWEKVEVSLALPAEEPARTLLSPETHLGPAYAALDAMAYQLPSPQGPSNTLPLFFARAPLVEEQEPNESPAAAQKITVPCEYVGRFGAGADADWVEFSAKAGEVFFLEVLSQQMGLDTDPLLTVVKVIKNDKGEEQASQVAQVDDLPQNKRQQVGYEFPTADPEFRLAADADATYRLCVRNQFARQHPHPAHNYRLAITKNGADFRLAVAPQVAVNQQNNNKVEASALSLRKGGSAALLVTVFRRAEFTGEIQVSVEGLPAGVTCAGAVLGGEVESATLVFTAAENAARHVGPLRIVGKASLPGKELVREARVATVVWVPQNVQQQPVTSRLVRTLWLAVNEKETDPATVQVGDGGMLETAPGGKLELPIKLARRNFTEALKLSAMGLPDQIKPSEVNIAGGAADGKLEIALNNPQLKPGVYTFCLQGNAKLKYQRNPEAAQRMESEKGQVEQVAKTLLEKSQQATTAKGAATTAAQQATTQRQQADTKRQNQQTAANQAAEKAKQAQEKVAAAQKAAEAEAANPGLKEAAANAEKEAAAATEEAKKMADLLTQATTEATAAAEAQTKAEQAKAEAEKVAAEAEAKAKMGEQRRTQFNTELDKVKKSAEAKDVNALVVSSPIKLRIAQSPLALAEVAPLAVKQGEKVTLNAVVQRLFGYAEGVEVLVDLPQGVPGLSQKKVDLPKDQSTAQVELATAKETPPGEYGLTMRARARWNNVASEVSRPLVLKVEPAPAP